MIKWQYFKETSWIASFGKVLPKERLLSRTRTLISSEIRLRICNCYLTWSMTQGKSRLGRLISLSRIPRKSREWSFEGLCFGTKQQNFRWVWVIQVKKESSLSEFQWKFIKQNYFTLYYLTQQFDKKRVLTLL